MCLAAAKQSYGRSQHISPPWSQRGQQNKWWWQRIGFQKDTANSVFLQNMHHFQHINIEHMINNQDRLTTHERMQAFLLRSLHPTEQHIADQVKYLVRSWSKGCMTLRVIPEQWWKHFFNGGAMHLPMQWVLSTWMKSVKYHHRLVFSLFAISLSSIATMTEGLAQ